jgi:hypothetical protein
MIAIVGQRLHAWWRDCGVFTNRSGLGKSVMTSRRQALSKRSIRMRQAHQLHCEVCKLACISFLYLDELLCDIATLRRDFMVSSTWNFEPCLIHYACVTPRTLARRPSRYPGRLPRVATTLPDADRIAFGTSAETCYFTKQHASS